MTNQLRIEPARRTLTAMHILEMAKATGILLLGVAALIAAIRFAIPPTGSFQLLQLGEYRRDQYLLDTQTGKVWVSVCWGTVSGADCSGSLVWEEVKRKK